MKFGQGITKHFNFAYPRRIQGAWINVPVVAGRKVGIRGELFLLQIFKHFLPSVDGAVLDVGVNVGQSLAKTKLADPSRRYYGFEPNVSCFHYLERLVAENHWDDVTFFPFGLSSSTAVLPLQVTDRVTTDSRASFVANVRNASATSVEKNAVVFEFSVVDKLITDKIALIKIDVEGAELDVLTGLRDALRRDRPILCIELLPLDALIAQHTRAFELLQSLQYDVYLVIKHPKNRWGGLRLIECYEGFEDVHCSDFISIHRDSSALLDGIPMY